MLQYPRHHLEQIQNEYRRIDSQWLHLQQRLMLWLTIVTAVMEVVMFFALRHFELLSSPAARYMVKYVLVPSLCDASLCAATVPLLRSRRLSERQKAWAVSLATALMAFVIYTVHAVFEAIFLIFTIPMVLTVVYGDQLLTGVTSAVCIASKIISDLFILWDAARSHVLATHESAIDFSLSLILLAVFYGICSFLLRVEREKNDVGIVLEQERQRYQEESLTDALTRVGNRQALRHAFQAMEEDESETPYCLAMMDLDDFKKLNDTYGHVQGDRCLQLLGRVLLTAAPHQGSPFRFGGDEFCILYRGLSLSQAQDACRQLQAHFAQESAAAGLRAAGISAGVARYRRGERPTHLLSRADEALYRAKQEKGIVCIESE